MTSALSQQGGREVTRVIHFFWVANEFSEKVMKRLDASKVCLAIGGLKGKARYMNAKEGGVYTSRLLDPTDTDRFILGKVRRDEIPLTEAEGGTWGTLSLPETVGVADVIHIRFFGNNIVGIDANRDGPWPTKLRDYLQDRLPAYVDFSMSAIIDKDTLARLNSLQRIKSVEIAISEPTLNHVPQGDTGDFLRLLHRLPKVAGAGIIKIGWRPLGVKEILDTPTMKKLLTALLEARPYFDRKTHIKVVGYDKTNQRHDFDLAQDRLVSRQTAVKLGRDRSIDPQSAFHAIEQAYDECKARFPAQKFAR